LVIKYQWDIISYLLRFIITFRNFLNGKWYLDFIQNNYFALFMLKHSYETFYKVVDKGFIEIISVNWFSWLIRNGSKNLLIKYDGNLYSTLCLLVINLIFIICMLNCLV
jgi:hypothetical protein